MAKLPGWKRIYEQDYDEKYQDLVRQLGANLNYGIQALYDVLNGKLTFADNMESTVKEFSVTVDAQGIPTTQTLFKKNDTTRITGLVIIRADNATNATTYPTSGVFISYTETTDTVFINHVTGLQANQPYNITVITIQ